MSHVAMLLATIIMLILLSLTLIAIGLRGRIVRRGPTCRACSFDLSGLATPLVTCPECGKSLALPRAVRPHLRRVRITPLLTGGVLLLAIAGLLAVAGSGRMTSPAVQARLPQAVLRAEARFGSPELARTALTEALTRMTNSELDQATVRTWAGTALAIQADRQHAWLGEWGDIIVHARENGQVSDAEWSEYALNSFYIELEGRARVERGTTVAVRATCSVDRVGTGKRLRDPVRIASVRAHVLGVPIDVKGTGFELWITDGMQDAGLFWVGTPDMVGAGVVEVDLVCRVQADTKSQTRSGPTIVRTVSLPVTIVEQGQATVTAVHPSTDLSSLVHASDFVVRNYPKTASLTGTISVDRIPIPIAALIVVRLGGGQEVVWLPNVFRGNERQEFGGLRLPRAILPGESIDLILRPDREITEWAFDIHEYADTEIVIRDIPVTIAN